MFTPFSRSLPSRRSLRACVIALFLAVGPVGCTSGTDDAASPTPPRKTAKPKPANPAAPTGAAGGAIAFERTGHDFGRVTDIRTYRTTFTFTNTGAETLEITGAKPSCGCLKVFRASSVFAPGATGTLEVEFDPKGKRGVGEKSVAVTTSANATPITLALSWNVAPLIEMEPRSIDFGIVALHEPHVRRAKVLYVDPGLEIVEVTCRHPNVTARTLDAGAVHATNGDEITRSTTIEVTIDEDAPWGTLYGTPLYVSLRATGPTPDEPLEHTTHFPLAGTIYGEITATSTSFGDRVAERSTVSVGRVRPGARFEQSTLLRHVDGQPFDLLDVTLRSSLFPGLEIRTEPEGPAGHRIYFSGDPGDFRGSVNAVLDVTTNIDTEGVLTILLLGQVR